MGVLHVVSQELFSDVGRDGDARRLEVCYEQRHKTVRLGQCRESIPVGLSAGHPAQLRLLRGMALCAGAEGQQ
jgi:hypothetical protein